MPELGFSASPPNGQLVPKGNLCTSLKWTLLFPRVEGDQVIETLTISP